MLDQTWSMDCFTRRSLAVGAAGGGGCTAAAVSHQGLELSWKKKDLELSKNWPCLPMNGNINTVEVYNPEDED